MSPKAGTKVSLVTPLEPVDASEAADSAAGKVDEFSSAAVAAKAGSTASTKIGGPADAPPEKFKQDPDKKGWIEIVLKDEEGTPQGGTRYKITLPDGSVADGSLDDKGKARVEGFDSGQCKVEFPELDEKVWKEN